MRGRGEDGWNLSLGGYRKCKFELSFQPSTSPLWGIVELDGWNLSLGGYRKCKFFSIISFVLPGRKSRRRGLLQVRGWEMRGRGEDGQHEHRFLSIIFIKREPQ